VAGTAIQLIGVHKRYRVYKERYRSLKEILFHRRFGEWEEHWVLQNLDLLVRQGSTLGLIGSNGAGKSTTLKLMSRILVPDRGEVRVRGRVSGLLELGAGFQPEYTGRENVYLNASLLGLSRADIKGRFDDIVGFAELEEHIDNPLRTYSSGMFMRLGFAVAIHVEPEVLLVDEILAVGDEAFQRKCLDWIEDFQRSGGTIVMVSHNMASIREMCDEVAWLEHGRLRQFGEGADVVDAYVDNVRDAIERGEEMTREARAVDGNRRAIELGEVRLTGEDGSSNHEFQLGAPMTIEIPYRVNRPVPKPVFGVAIHRNDGVLAYATNTDVDGLDLGHLNEEGMLRFTCRSLSLLAGGYRVTVAVLGSPRLEEPPIDSHWQRYPLRVGGGVRREQGVTRLEHGWEMMRPQSKLASG
jgi:ABC-type polysaccharide/polyol phosphate transport system ATPase subunit